jgi:DNA (cytosine-5)-methyltransferase 1
MKYLSVCSGIEAASLACHPLGWTPLAFSEIEAFPRAVLAHHYPDVPCHGDFTKLRDEAWIADADMLVGGTPCQAFSVAGLRNSLSDDRGNLSLEFVRLADAIDDLRRADGREPAIIVWENVPGVLSVKDNAFGCFLAALAGDAAPYDPPRGKWTNAGVVDGPARTVAWRILDAQYFGLAQRRRRVFVVSSARDGFDPAAVLLEFEGLRRDTPPRREAGQVAPTIPSRSTAGGGLGTDFDCDGGVITLAHGQGGAEVACERSPTLTCIHEAPIAAYPVTAHNLRAEGFDASEDGTGRGTPLVPVAFSAKDHGADAAEYLSPTLRAMPHNHSHANGGGQMAVAVSLRGRDGGGTAELGGDYVMQPVAFAQNTRDEVRLQGGDGQIVGALAAEPGMKQTTYVAVPLQEVGKRTGVSTDDPRAGIGIGQDGDPMFTLQAGAQHGVATVEPYTLAIRGRGDTHNLEARQDGLANALLTPNGGRAGIGVGAVAAGMAVRRLTPVECERLQGFPDGYTNIPWRGKPEAPDGPRYKALGNSMAVPVMRWIGTRIKQHLGGEL